MDELSAFLRLTWVSGLHAGHLQRLLPIFESVAGILAAERVALRAAGVGGQLLERLAVAGTAALDGPLRNTLRWLEHPNHSFIQWGSAGYPPLLAEISDAPVGLFVRGKADALYLPQLAMVGTRNPTAAGRETATAFAAHLARSGLTITSGLAVGIDAASHRGALSVAEGAAGAMKSGIGLTIAVCGTGLDSVYPREHEALARQIAAHGALVSELPPGSPVMKLNFPRRNRLISGLSLGTLVVEAAARSGSLITARLAGEQGREVFAVPGSIHNPLARGCHQLICQGAKLVENSLDIISELEPLAGVLAETLADQQVGAVRGAVRGTGGRAYASLSSDNPSSRSGAAEGPVGRLGGPRRAAGPVKRPPLGGDLGRSVGGSRGRASAQRSTRRATTAAGTLPLDYPEISAGVLDKDYKILLDAVGFDPTGMDVLIQRTGFKAEAVASMLLILELEGRIESYPGGLYLGRVPKSTQ